MKAHFIVTLELPKGVTKTEMKEYIIEAVSGWCGGIDPEDPLFDIRHETVKCKGYIPPKAQKYYPIEDENGSQIGVGVE